MLRSTIAVAICAAELIGMPLLVSVDEASGKRLSRLPVRAASDRLYSDILLRACSNGWRYTTEQLESGFRRHLSEFTVQLLATGYVIKDVEHLSRASSPGALQRAIKRCTLPNGIFDR